MGTLIILICLAMAQSQTPATRRPDTAASAKKPGSVEGTLSDAISGAPIKSATVTLEAVNRRYRYIAVTDNTGRFQFPQVEPGEGYTAASDIEGYMTPPRTRQSMRDAPPISVAGEQTVRNVSIKLIPVGSINGKVVDEDGEPVPDVSVEMWQYRFGPNGRRLELAGDATTDNRGIYRLHGIYPGPHILRANANPVPPVLPGPPEHIHSTIPEEGFAPLYFPNGKTAAEATPIMVPPAGDIAGIDFHLARVTVYHVRGRIDGSKAKRMRIEDAPCVRGSHLVSRIADLKPNGSFDLPYILPGTYCFVTDPPGSYAPVDGTVTVKDRDVNGVFLTTLTDPNLMLVLRVESESASIPSKPQLMLRNGGRQFPVYEIASGGGLAFVNVEPGNYWLQANSLPKGMYLKSIQFGDRDVTRDEFIVTPAGGTLTVVLATDSGQISGTVQDSDSKPGDNTLVALAPKTPIPSRPDLYQTATTAPDGSFRFATVPPGEYRVIALETFDAMLVRAPEFLKQFEGSVEGVAVSPSQTASVHLKSIASQAIEDAKGKLQ